MAWTSVKRLADAIINDVRGGLRNYHQNMSLSVEQLEEEIVQTRLAVIKEYLLKGILPIEDLLVSLNCIPVDCDTLDKCKCRGTVCGDPTAHFLIPLILFDYGLGNSIKYIGSSDKQHSFLVYTKPINRIETILKYRRRGKHKPWVYVDVTPNSDGLIDCYIFGAPLIKQVSVVAIFKDPRLLEDFLCDCDSELKDATFADYNLNFLDILIKDRLTQLKLRYYRQFAPPVLPNDLTYAAG